jgi:hypothetical protein
LPRLRIERTDIANKVFFEKHPGATHLGAGYDAGADQLAQGFGVDVQQCRGFL